MPDNADLRCAHCGGGGGDWIPWRGACYTVRHVTRERPGDDLLCAFCERHIARGDLIDVEAGTYREARQRLTHEQSAPTL